MGLKLASEGGVPRAPPPTRLVPDGQVAVAIRGGLPWVATPETDAVSTTVGAGPPVANTGINVEANALLALIVTLPTRMSTTPLLSVHPSDGHSCGRQDRIPTASYLATVPDSCQQVQQMSSDSGEGMPSGIPGVRRL